MHFSSLLLPTVLLTARLAVGQSQPMPADVDPIAALAAWRADQPAAVIRAVEARAREVAADPAQRAAMARRLEEVLASGASPDAKDAALRQLLIVGDARSVAAVAPLVTEPRLGTLALDVVRLVSTSEGENGQSVDLVVLLPALEATLRQGQAAQARTAEIIGVLGRSRSPEIIETLAGLARSASPEVRCAALSALASSPSPAAAEHLAAPQAPAGADDTEAARTCTIDALLRATRVRFAAGDRQAVERLLARASALANADHERLAVAAATMACAGLGDAAAVRSLLTDERPEWFGTGVELVRSSPNPALTASTLATLPALAPGSQALVIRALGERGDAAAAESLLRFVREAGPDEVRIAACEALSRVGDAAAVPLLVARSAEANESGPNVEASGGLASAAESALVAMRAPGVDAALITALESVPTVGGGDWSDPAFRAGMPLLRVIAARRVAEATPVVLGLARIENAALRQQAFATLGSIARQNDLPRLVDLVKEQLAPQGSGPEIAALVAASRRVPDPVARVAPIVAVIDGGGEANASISGLAHPAAAEALLLALGELGGEEAMRCLARCLEDRNLRRAAVLALCKWPDAGALAPLGAVARQESDPRLRRIAAAGLVKVATQASGDPPAARAEGLRTALELAGDDRHRTQIIKALGTLGDRAALAVLVPLLGSDQGQQAGAAIVECARAMPTGQRRHALAALEQVVAQAAADDPALRREVGAAADAIEREVDFIQSWQVAGPFARDGAGLADLMAIEFAPEKDPDGPEVFWREVPPVDGARGWRAGVVDLARVLASGQGAVENRVAYLRTRIDSPQAQRVRLELGSDDGVKAWLNGRVVHERNVPRGLRAGEDVVEVDLPAGESTLLLKITQGAGDWAACCRLRGVDGFAARGVRTMADLDRAAPPPGAMRLMADGDLAAWVQRGGAAPRWSDVDGVTTVVPGTGDLLTREAFGDCTLHVEFRCPDTPPEVVGQARGNSGVYLQDRYEVQVLDAFGDAPAKDLVGAIYGVRPAAVPVARRPGEWQDLLIDFTAPRWDTSDPASPRKLANARMTVWLNGVRVHDDVEVPGTTTAGATEGPGDGPVRLQDHGNAVQFRNVWIVPRPGWEGPAAAGFQALFNGRDVDGWTRRGGAADYVVEEGAIVGRSKPNQPNTFLCTDRAFGDFVLELEFKVDPEMNSGVQFRSAARPEGGSERVFGYQSEIDPSNRAWTGGIYDEARRGWLAPPATAAGREAFLPGEWNRLRIEARGPESRTWINGVPVANLWDRHAPQGFVGLQVHGVGDRQDPLSVRWRDVRVRELAAPPVPAGLPSRP